MSGNLGFKPIFRSNDRRDVKQYKQRQARQRYCKICGKPFIGSGHTCNSCSEFIQHKKKSHR